MICILTEKPSAAKNFAVALGGRSGVFDGQQYTIVNSVGHIFRYPQKVSVLVPEEKKEIYDKWDLEHLPWDEKDFQWRKELASDKKDVYDTIKKACMNASEIIIATDDDPSGEGTVLADEILLSLHLRGKRYSRMFFEDESVRSIQKAFRERKEIPVLTEDPDYIKALYRSMWDYLSMQFTRIATCVCPKQKLVKNGQINVLRNGRLKSFMNVLVGRQLEAYNDYTPVTTYEPAFQDEEGVWYTRKDADQYQEKDKVPLQELHESGIVFDGKDRKHTAPPKLLDLAALSALLAGTGLKADRALSTYQKMYEDAVVSYPRTEDKTITPEQFAELEKNVDRIAAVVGIDRRLLTHRAPRNTHVKSEGSHGANRPGPKIPSSMEQLEEKYGKEGALIYKTLAYGTLLMFCEDFVYDTLKGHVKDFPEYTGSVNDPVSLGYKQIWKEPEDRELLNHKKLGTRAVPKIKENVSKRPPYPTMKWLMKQLEKYNVGTGATRTSCYAELVQKTSGRKGSTPLLVEQKGKLSLSEYGDINYRLLDGTLIGGPELTERLQEEMHGIAKGRRNTDEMLHSMQEFVRHDLQVMKKNAVLLFPEGMDAAPEPPKETGLSCPFCGGKILQLEWGYACSAHRKNSGCGFFVGKSIQNVPVPMEAVGRLISTGTTGTLRSETGTSLCLSLDRNEKKVSLNMASYLPDAVCPECGSPVTATPKTYMCSRHRNGCSFFMYNQFAKKKITEKQAVLLLKGETVKMSGLHKTAGGTFSGNVYLKKENGEWKLGLSY